MSKIYKHLFCISTISNIRYLTTLFVLSVSSYTVLQQSKEILCHYICSRKHHNAIVQTCGRPSHVTAQLNHSRTIRSQRTATSHSSNTSRKQCCKQCITAVTYCALKRFHLQSINGTFHELRHLAPSQKMSNLNCMTLGWGGD
jgi:hypothetical protein